MTPVNFTSEQVLNLAPDASSAKAGQGLASPRHWQGLGRNPEALWGLCQGSGKTPYQVRIALPELATSCSCPSRKFPCKHALGLMLLAAAQPDAVLAAEPPEFVAEWLAKRGARAEKSTAKDRAEPAPPDPGAAARTAKKREAQLGTGLLDLKAWLEDLVGAGFANASVREPSFWDARARRLVDAQAPGLARAVGELAGAALREDNWPERLLRGLSPIYLAAEAFERAETLPPGLRADLFRAIGLPQRQEDVDAKAAVEDDWLCLGQSSEDLDRVIAHRTWLLGRNTGLRALILNFAPRGQPSNPPALAGWSESMRLGFYPGSLRQRALIVARGGNPVAAAAPEAVPSLAAELERHAAAVSADPWLNLSPFLVRARLGRDGRGAWWLADADGAGLPVRGEDLPLWQWFARSGGRACVYSGEWDGERFRLLHGWPEAA
jgi:hypothetical protein